MDSEKEEEEQQEEEGGAERRAGEKGTGRNGEKAQERTAESMRINPEKGLSQATLSRACLSTCPGHRIGLRPYCLIQ